MTVNQNPEQKAWDRIDEMLRQAGGPVQSKDKTNFYAVKGIAVREYTTFVGPADQQGLLKLRGTLFGNKMQTITNE